VSKKFYNEHGLPPGLEPMLIFVFVVFIGFVIAIGMKLS